MGRHVGHQFLAAADDSLSARDRQRFEAHLDACRICHDDFEAYLGVVEAVQALPRARMPVPVRVPEGVPRAAATWSLARLRMWLRRRQPMTGLATAVAAVAAVAVILIGHGGSVTPPPSAAVATGGQGMGLAPLAVPSATGATCITQLLTWTAAPGQAAATATDGSDATYPNRVVRTDPARPQQQLVVATSSSQAAPGTAITLYARLSLPAMTIAAPGGASRPAGSLSLVPCVEITGGALLRTPFTAANPQQNAAAQPGGPVTNAGRIEATPSLVPVQQIVIPASARRGSVIRITAHVPADTPYSGQPAMDAEISVIVG